LPTTPAILGGGFIFVASLSATVDWFCFWLKGEEDPGPAKAEQYKRWRELKQMQKENDDKAKAAPTN